MPRRIGRSREDARATLKLAGWTEQDILKVIPYSAIEERSRQISNTIFKLDDDAERPTSYF